MLVKPSSPRLPTIKNAIDHNAILNGRHSGFTLVELMVVIAILGIMAAFAIPSISGWIANTRTRTVAEAMQNGIRLAQTEAVRRGVQVQFVLTDASPTTAGVATSNAGRNWVIQTAQAPNQFLQGAALGSVSANSLVNGEAAITFNSMGRLVIPTRTAVYNLVNPAGNRPLRVTVSIAGRVRMCDPSVLIANRSDGC